MSYTFGIADYAIFLTMVIVSMLIGVYMSFRGQKTAEDYLVASRSYGFLPVGLSLLSTFVSAVNILGISGEVYAFGTQLTVLTVGGALGIAAAGLVCVPVFYPMKLTSVNEYMKARFGSTKLRMVLLVFSIVKSLVAAGVSLYASAIAMEGVTTFSWLSYTFGLGLIVTAYTSLSGVRGVIASDVFQVFFIIIGQIVVVSLGLVEVGGLSKVWKTSYEGQRIEFFNMAFNLSERHTFFNTILFGFTINFYHYGLSQVYVQRLGALKSMKDVKYCLLLNIIGMMFMNVIITLAGLIVYTAFVDCDPWTKNIVPKKEGTLTYFLVQRLNHVTGLCGLIMATLVGASLSTVSSCLNAQVAMFWKDICLRYQFFSKMAPLTARKWNTLLSFLFGILDVVVAIMFSYGRRIVEAFFTVNGLIYGAIFGLFILGLFFPKCNAKGAWCGFTFSIIFLSWILLGKFMVGVPPKALPLSVEGCNAVGNLTAGVTSPSVPVEVVARSVITNGTSTRWDYMFPDISYTFYPFLGIVSCVLSGLLVSLATGNEDLKNISPKCVSPFVRKYYWKPEELEDMLQDENKTVFIDKDKNNEERIPMKVLA